VLSIKDLLCRIASSPQVCAVNDNSGAPVPDYADPYLTEACETKRLVEGARLISSVDGNPAAILNLMATRERKGRRAA
jgi:hypothetical protein